MKVKDILKQKGPEVFTIGDEKTLADAVKVLAANNIGVLLVLSSEAKIVGIISERDIIRKLASDPEGCLSTKVKDVMTRQVIVVEPEDDLEYVERVMTQNRCRHVPVISNKVLVGLISIGDIVKSMHKETEIENKYLKDYIAGAIS
ncbi:MAG: CBS domain-containing protein [Ignavibacteria bacterium]|nr:CBS domain-containing protein [Ignavibacteria bacterium]